MHREFRAPAELRDAIQCFWYDQRDFAGGETSFEVLPDSNAEIIFHFGGGCNIVTAEGPKPLPSPFLMGLLKSPARFYAEGRLQIIGVRCFPWTVFDLLGLPSSKNSLRTFEHPIARLQPLLNDLLQAGRMEEAVERVQQAFGEARSRVETGSLLAKAGAAMREAQGSLPVSGVAAAAHASVRTLERAFKQAAGHTVKDVSGLMRFEQVRNRLWLQPNTGLAGLAQELGYADQSHLSREFRRYSGTTPAAFARKAARERLAAADFVAFVQD